MKPGSLGTNFPDRSSPTALLNQKMEEVEIAGLGLNHGPGAPRMFGDGAQEYFQKYGANVQHLAQIGWFFTPHGSIHRLTCFVQLQRTINTRLTILIHNLGMAGVLNRY